MVNFVAVISFMLTELMRIEQRIISERFLMLSYAFQWLVKKNGNRSQRIEQTATFPLFIECLFRRVGALCCLLINEYRESFSVLRERLCLLSFVLSYSREDFSIPVPAFLVP